MNRQGFEEKQIQYLEAIRQLLAKIAASLWLILVLGFIVALYAYLH